MRLLVIGESCTDEHIYGTVRRVCPEAPVPIIEPIKTIRNAGMAGNTHANLKALGIEADFICNKQDIIKRRYVDTVSGQMLLRVDIDDSCPGIDFRLLHEVNYALYDAVVISDYDKGFLDEDAISYITKHSKLSFLDTKKELSGWAKFADFIKVNKTEAESIPALWRLEFASKLITTLGKDGAQYMGQIFPTKSVAIYNVSGAGDTFLAGLVYEYLRSNDAKRAIEFANVCAAEVVQKPGVVTVC